jgi:putative oxidoreductase
MDRLQDAILLLGRLLMAALFLPSGLRKAFGFQGFVSTLNERGLPYPEVWAVAALAIEVLGPIALLAGVLPRASALALIAFVIAATATSHRFWEFQEPARRMQEINFYKNIGIISGLLFYLVSGAGAWAWGRGLSQQGHVKSEQAT